jgi:hypothetical protein
MDRAVIAKHNHWFVCASVEIMVCGNSEDENFVHILFENCLCGIRPRCDFDFEFNPVPHSRAKYLGNMKVC